MDLDAALALPEPVGGGAVAQKTTEAEESRWASTSSVESTFENFWVCNAELLGPSWGVRVC